MRRPIEKAFFQIEADVSLGPPAAIPTTLLNVCVFAGGIKKEVSAIHGTGFAPSFVVLFFSAAIFLCFTYFAAQVCCSESCVARLMLLPVFIFLIHCSNKLAQVL